MSTISENIQKLTACSPRQGTGERAAAGFLRRYLKERSIPFDEQFFGTAVPVEKQARLTVDGQDIACLATTFVSGTIHGKESLVSSLIPSRYLIDVPNINFNPAASDISRSNHYFAPSVAIARGDVSRVLQGSKVRAEVEVSRFEYESANLLVGNLTNPQTIVFAHYDGIAQGVTDNASGVAVLLSVVKNDPDRLNDVLCIFAGNEELSYDQPTYWGHGFREFEKEFAHLLRSCKKIVVIDSVGNGPTQVSSSDQLIYLSFPLSDSSLSAGKTVSVHGDIRKLMSVYHTEADDASQVSKRFLTECSETVTGLL